MTTALLSVEVICDTASENKDAREVSERDLDEQGEALAAFKRMQCYMSSFPIDKASMQQLTTGKGAASLSDMSNKTDNVSTIP
jgi:hypothetical protein